MTDQDIFNDNNNPPLEIQFGNPDLPITVYRGEILNAIETNQATVISAETGAGKSTQVPQYLAEAGYDVIVTQPRVIAARTVSDRVEKEMGNQQLVGYRTARESNTNPNNCITFCTDGLQVVRELAGNTDTKGKKQVLVLDEVHEWNTNMEVLVAWAKQRMQDDPDFKVVTMSATLDGESLSKYFGENTPHIEVPGRTFPVEKREGGYFIDETETLAKQGKNILVFLPGKQEIQQATQDLLSKDLDVPIIALHGQLEKSEQQKAFMSYPNGKIILATNVAQTSLTIDDIDAVVDTGLERRTEIREGVEGLYLEPISKADCLQRAGRAGRTKEGEYLLASLDKQKPILGFDERPDYPIPEINRTRLDNLTLRLAAHGIDIDAMDFYHQPNPTLIHASKERLTRLGAIDSDGDLTNIGRQMERMPIDAHFSRMLIEAKKYSQEVRSALIDMIAIQQIGGIVKNGKYTQAWKELIGTETDSDMLAQLEVFNQLRDIPRKEWQNYDVLGKNVNQVKHYQHLLRHALHTKTSHYKLNDINKESIMKCIVSGFIDQAWFMDTWSGQYKPALLNDSSRELSSSSVVKNANYVVAEQFDLSINTRRGPKTLRLLQNITRINPEWLAEIAPQLLSSVPDGYTKFYENGTPYNSGRLMFGKLTISDTELTTTPDQLNSALVNALLSGKHKQQSAYKHYISELQMLSQSVKVFDQDFANELNNRFSSLISDIVSERGYKNLHTALGQPPVIREDMVFSDSDIDRVQNIMQKYPTLIPLSDDTSLTVNYSRSHQSEPLKAQINIKMSQAKYINQSLLPEVSSIIYKLFDDDCIEMGSYHSLDSFLTNVEKIQKSKLLQHAEQEAIENGAPQDVGGYVRWNTGADNNYYWVITPEGELRQPDEINRDDVRWRVIMPGEIFLQGTHPHRDPLSDASYLTLHRPTHVTEKQMQAIRGLEESIGSTVPLWELNDDEYQKRSSTIEAIMEDEWLSKTIKLTLADNVEMDTLYLSLVSNSGLSLISDPFVEFADLQPSQYEYCFSASNREASQIDCIELGNGYTVQVLLFEKFGHWNMALKLIESDNATQNTSPPTDSDTVTQDDLDALVARFAKKKER